MALLPSDLISKCEPKYRSVPAGTPTAGVRTSEMKSIGKYQVIEQLGTSATGTTYRVRDSFRNREFALKVLQTVPGLTSAAKEQFCGHLAACAELVHRHVIKVQDLGEVEEGLFVVSDWRTGMDLERFMRENRDLPLGQKLGLVAQVAEGLAFANSREIAHGDLKPSNVFVDGARDVTILDFGIAKWLAALLEAGSRPEGLVVNYLAPEQVLGSPFDARSDIFALGLMLYEFVSGKYPFAAEPGLIPREIVHSEAEPLRSLDPQIPEELDQLVQRALRKDPAERLQTAEEFAAGLYVAAQELRRRASAAAPAAPPATPSDARRPAERMAVETPAPAPEPIVQQATAFTTPASAPQAPPQREAEQKVRERPQDETGPPKPWTARSYANAPLTKEMPAFQRQPPAEPPDNPAALPATIPEQAAPLQAAPVAPPVRRPKPKPSAKTPPAPPPPPTISKTTKRALTAVVGLILAAGVVGSFVSHQGLKASQNKSPAPAVVARPPALATPANPQTVVPQEPAASKPGESGPDDIGNPEFSAKQTLHGPVRSLWESGRYAEALALVNQVLADNPNSAEARVWKKKIHDAQEAEAALK
jgi:serine/threonine protein kinase